jgi:hypothetical protein
MAVFWSGGCQSDVVDHHHYPQPVVPYDLADIAAQQGKAFLLGEYGGISVDVPKHMWNSSCDRAASKKGTFGGGRVSHPLPRRALMRSVGVHASGEGVDEGGDEGSEGGGDPNSLGATFTRYNEMVGQGLLAKGLAGQIFTQVKRRSQTRETLQPVMRVYNIWGVPSNSPSSFTDHRHRVREKRAYHL